MGVCCAGFRGGGGVDSLQPQKEVFEVKFGVNNFQQW